MEQKDSLIKRIVHFLTTGIWSVSLSEMPAWSKRGVALLRVINTSYDGVMKNRIPSQAASLSYTTLLALGPMIALVILISSIFLREQGDAFICEKIMNAIEFTMPAINEIEYSATAVETGASINPQILEFVEKISKGSGSLGTFGSIAIVVTCLLLCVTLENAINSVWSITEGRSWKMRIVYYWTFICFGSVAGIFGITFLASSQLSSFFVMVPYFEHFASWGTYVLGLSALILLFTCMFKFLPNTYVRFNAALWGGILAVGALILNNKLSFLYISIIVKNQNFYGYLAIIPIALFSLYIFWLFVLTGAQLSYAVHNIDFLSSKYIWEKLTNRSKNIICFAMFAKIAKSFYEKTPPLNVEVLAQKLNLPKAVIKYCILTMIEKGLVSSAEDTKKDSEQKVYIPAISPDSITLYEFFKTLESSGDDDYIERTLIQEEKSISSVLDAYAEFSKTQNASKTLKDLI